MVVHVIRCIDRVDFFREDVFNDDTSSAPVLPVYRQYY